MMALPLSGIAVLVVILAICQGQDNQSLRVRLSSGRNALEGRVEIYYRGIWGAVCDDKWDTKDGDVVCRMLGYIKARKVSCCSKYGTSASLRIFLDDVQCTGRESSLFDCESRTAGEHNCDPKRESAGVVCQGRARLGFLKSLNIRLQGGPSHEEGRVEIFHEDEWGSICDDGWSLNNGHVVCSILGFDQADGVSRNGKYGISSKMWLDDVRCKGTEQSLEACRARPWGENNCNLMETAGVKCSKTKGKNGLLFRLSGSPNKHEGRVEVLHKGVWGAVCDDYWKLRSGHVICRYLGYERALETSCCSKYRASTGGHMFMDDINCKGDENWLFDCKHRKFGEHNCNRYKETAGVVCDKSTYRTQPPLACSAGYELTRDGLNCTDIDECGDERNNCTYDCVNTIASYKCICPKGFQGDGITCKKEIKITKPGTEKVRLRDGSTPDEGRVEVWNEGVWATICDDFWDLRDGNVVCRVLGYLRAKNVACCNSFRGSNGLHIMLDDVGCTGRESSLFSCKNSGWGNHNCQEGTEEAGVICTNEPPPTFTPPKEELYKIKFRLMGGATPHEGRVEMFFRNRWGAICDDYWKLRNGHVICRQLGYRRANSVSCCSKYGVVQSGLIWLDDVQCTARDRSLLTCRHRAFGHNNCNKEETAGVECSRGAVTLPPTTLPTTTPTPLPTMRIVGGPTAHEGRVEVLLEGIWGAVCDKGWQLRDGDVLCRTLGYYRAMSISCCSAYGPSSSGRIWLSDIRCRGYESSIDKCGTRRREYYDCDDANLAGVKCLVDIPTTTRMPTLPTTVLPGFRVRIVGGKHPNEGAVNVFYEGTWGAVCDDNFGLNEGHVVCRMLGYERALRTPCCSRYPALLSERILMDDVECRGTESSLSQCNHAPWGNHNCNLNEVAGVFCQLKLMSIPTSPPIPITYVLPEKVRLAGTSFTTAGRVEIFFRGEWGAVCDDNWRLNNGHVTCRMLGFQRAKSVSYGGLYGSSKSNKIWLDEVNCKGSEQSLLDCQHRPYGEHDCKTTETAGVICQGQGRPNVTAAPSTVSTTTVLPTTPGIKCGQRLTVVARKKAKYFSSRKQNSLPGDWPWQAVIMNARKFKFCAGALISEQWVLTAAHCLDRARKSSDLIIRLGAHRRIPSSKTWLQDIAVAKFFKHPGYNRPMRYANDIALIKLKRPATLNKRVSPVCLTNNTQLFREGAKCWTSGWGLLQNFRRRARVLQKVSIPLRPLRYCTTYRRRILHKSMVCAGYSMRWADSCSGDSGGPLVCESQGSWYLEGVTTWGGDCKRASLYGLYSNVPYIMNWAYKIMKKN